MRDGDIGQPVAWRWQDSNGDWCYATKREWIDPGIAADPLYSDLLPPAVTEAGIKRARDAIYAMHRRDVNEIEMRTALEAALRRGRQ